MTSVYRHGLPFASFRLCKTLCETLCVGVCEGVLRTALNSMILLTKVPVCVFCAYHIGVNLMVRARKDAHLDSVCGIPYRYLVTVMLRWPVWAITACDNHVMSLLTSACDSLVNVCNFETSWLNTLMVIRASLSVHGLPYRSVTVLSVHTRM